MKHWALDEKGNLRKELYTMSAEELDQKEREGLEGVPEWSSPAPEGVKKLEPGDTIYVRPEYSVAEEFGGRMTFRQLSGAGGNGPCLFCRTDSGGGGFVGIEMLVNANNPKSPTPDQNDINRYKDAESERIREFRAKRGTWPVKTR